MKRLPFWPVAWTLAVFFAVSFTLDVLAGLLFPNWWVRQNFYEMLLPGYTFIGWGAYYLGLVEIFIGGILTAVIFVPIWNFFAAREETKTTPKMTEAIEHQ
jgi:hypothetical protein